jgi:hypothetical protein
VLAAVCIALFWFVLLPKPRYTQAMCDRIHRGMTQEEVQAILGLPDGLHYNVVPPITPGNPSLHQKRIRMDWYSLSNPDSGAITVEFDEKGKVERTQYHRTLPMDWLRRIYGSLLVRLLRWLY